MITVKGPEHLLHARHCTKQCALFHSLSEYYIIPTHFKDEVWRPPTFNKLHALAIAFSIFSN